MNSVNLKTLADLKLNLVNFKELLRSFYIWNKETFEYSDLETCRDSLFKINKNNQELANIFNNYEKSNLEETKEYLKTKVQQLSLLNEYKHTKMNPTNVDILEVCLEQIEIDHYARLYVVLVNIENVEKDSEKYAWELNLEHIEAIFVCRGIPNIYLLLFEQNLFEFKQILLFFLETKEQDPQQDPSFNRKLVEIGKNIENLKEILRAKICKEYLVFLQELIKNLESKPVTDLNTIEKLIFNVELKHYTTFVECIEKAIKEADGGVVLKYAEVKHIKEFLEEYVLEKQNQYLQNFITKFGEKGYVEALKNNISKFKQLLRLLFINKVVPELFVYKKLVGDLNINNLELLIIFEKLNDVYIIEILNYLQEEKDKINEKLQDKIEDFEMMFLKIELSHYDLLYSAFLKKEKKENCGDTLQLTNNKLYMRFIMNLDLLINCKLIDENITEFILIMRRFCEISSLETLEGKKKYEENKKSLESNLLELHIVWKNENIVEFSKLVEETFFLNKKKGGETLSIISQIVEDVIEEHLKALIKEFKKPEQDTVYIQPDLVHIENFYKEYIKFNSLNN